MKYHLDPADPTDHNRHTCADHVDHTDPTHTNMCEVSRSYISHPGKHMQILQIPPTKTCVKDLDRTDPI